MKPIYIIFSGEGPTLEFVEIEDAEGNGVKAGEWKDIPSMCGGEAGCDHPAHKAEDCFAHLCKCSQHSSDVKFQRLGPFYTKEAMLELLEEIAELS